MIESFVPSSWQFRNVKDRRWLPASVPGCVHTDLLRAGKINDPFFSENELTLQWIEERDWHYRADFKLPDHFWKEQYIELVAEGLDTVATVSINGKPISRTDNMYHSHRWNIKDLLKITSNRIDIVFQSPMRYIRNTRTRFSSPFECNDPVGHSARIRKQPSSFGWDWGPRLVTSGIWKPLKIEAWSINRFDGVRIHQTHSECGVELHILSRLAQKRHSKITGTVSLEGRTLGEIKNGRFVIKHPKLWWPNGYGDQILYDIHLKLFEGGERLDSKELRIGLRDIRLEMTPSRGKLDAGRFAFKVNGRRIFCKGANWIPSDAFLANLGRSHYENLLRSAKKANMNMLRVWGGGIYEHDDFYHLCDELGLLIWQDAMFACSLYPADREFLKSVQREITQQAERLQPHACMAAWCGNNEIPMIFGRELANSAKLRKNYAALFVKTIPQAIREVDPDIQYLHSSPVRKIPGIGETVMPNCDDHDWSVWHSRAPISYFETTNHRFVSEFGMQSYPSPELAREFCSEKQINIFSSDFENHQKNAAGNQIVFDYISRSYRFPRDYTAISYLSQINQAECIQRAVQHYRRLMPRCSGTLFWQLNDCWPAASWSSLEFKGRWKALHYAARRFYAPAMVSFRHLGAETTGIGNYKKNTLGPVELWVVYDGIVKKKALLEWSLRDFDGNIFYQNKKSLELKVDSTSLVASVDFSKELERHGRRNCHAWAILKDLDGTILSSESTLFTAPRFLDLQKKTICCEIRKSGDSHQLCLRSTTFHHRVSIKAPANVEICDNYFDLPANETIRVEFKRAEKKSERKSILPKEFTTYSLIDTYEGL